MAKSKEYLDGFKAGFEEAQKCAADIAEMEVDYYDHSSYKADISRKVVADHIMDLIKGLRYDFTRGEQELIKGIKMEFPTEEIRKEFRKAYGYED